MSDVLIVEGLSKRYGRAPGGVLANDSIDLTIALHQIVCLLGHNGAGKSTLVNQVVGLTLPTAGTITLAGIDAVARPAEARALASVQAQANVPITGLTLRSAIELVGRIRGLRAAEARRRAAYLIAALDLGEWANRTAEKVSGGIARLTAFAMAVVAPGRLVVLDEPTNDVDPVRRRLLWHEMRVIADAGAGVLLVTHNLHEAEAVVDDVVLLDEGRVRAHGTPAELVAAHPGDTLEDVYIALLGHQAAAVAA
ncbi:MAG: ABC transporter ATP-binding protein [Propionibacteriaceae bacterium]|jgi:ABC-2 type transport system ATP-binding protein|nr:ABC transporter ATP-binding protein [Propionibacteriaceae bacterium]